MGMSPINPGSTVRFTVVNGSANITGLLKSQFLRNGVDDSSAITLSVGSLGAPQVHCSYVVPVGYAAGDIIELTLSLTDGSGSRVVLAHEPIVVVQWPATALPATPAGGVGGLITRGTAAGQLNPTGGVYLTSDAMDSLTGTNGPDFIATSRVGPVRVVGAAQSGGNDTTHVHLPTPALAYDDEYVGNWIKIYAGTGVGQMRQIVAYSGATKIATLHRALAIAPDTTSLVAVLLPMGVVGSDERALVSGDAHTSGLTVAGGATVVYTTFGSVPGAGPVFASSGGSVIDLDIAQNSAPAFSWVCQDSQGDAINLTGKTVRLVIHDGSGTVKAELDNGGLGGIVLSGGGSQVDASIPSTATVKTAAWEYKLWNAPDKALLASGNFHIKKAPIGT